MTLEKANAIEVNQKVHVHRITLQCSCGGEMNLQGAVKLTYPLQYTHECESCGAAETICGEYPRIEYRDDKGVVLDA